MWLILELHETIRVSRVVSCMPDGFFLLCDLGRRGEVLKLIKIGQL